MRFYYFQVIRVDQDRDVAVLDGSVGGGRRTAESKAPAYLDEHASEGILLESIPVCLEWQEDSSWQALDSIRKWDQPGLLQRLVDRDPPARLTGEVSAVPCFIWWSMDCDEAFPNFVFLSKEGGDNSFEGLPPSIREDYRYRMTEGTLQVPAGLTLAAEDEHKLWFQHRLERDADRRAL
jgi:hypothetical protein